ncbi:MAG TPA: glycosyltransferase 87 family protein, partial [Gemmataceae bacterium]|nr:glycosyltransferase 87 family protein [Gemmataceae bacterium]
EPVRGFNPIDVLRYKEYLQLMTDKDDALRPLDRLFTSAVLGTFPIQNQSLADLLGVRYLVQPRDLPLKATVPDAAARRGWQQVPAADDCRARTFNFVSATEAGEDCGLLPLPPYAVYENRHALPRAFVVPEAAPLPGRAAVLSALKATDFRRTVLLEDFEPTGAPKTLAGEYHAAAVGEYLPNRVTVTTDGPAAGYLVLTDVWFPGWSCAVDGRPARLYRADFLFRAVPVPAGSHRVVFTFAPASYRWGMAISAGMAVAVLGLSLLGLARAPGRRRTGEQAGQRSRRLLVGVSLAVTAVALVGYGPRLLDPSVLGVADFVEYWSAARLNATGGNPYCQEQLLPLQRQAGWDEDKPIPMWNPLWTLTLVTPFGLLSFAVARLLWLGSHLAIIVYAADWVWRYNGGPRSHRWLAWAAALSFCPTLIVVHMGQVGPLMLLGLVLFLRFATGRHAWLAGAALVLVAVKPHLVYLVWLAILLWGVDRRRWSVFLGAGLGVLATTALALCLNPALLNQYREAMAQRLVSDTLDYQAPTLGALLRLGLGEQLSWVQFLPTVLGLVWFVPYWIRRRRTWDWAEELPVLLLVSYATALYGWLGDQVILVPALVQAAVWVYQGRQRPAVRLVAGTYVALNAVVLLTKVWSVPESGQVWLAPALLIGYLVLRGQAARRCEAAAPVAASNCRPVLIGEGA